MDEPINQPSNQSINQPINQSINWTKLPQGSARNSSWWRKLWYSANSFDTRTLKTNHKAKRWIVLLNMGFSFTVYLKYLAISDESWKHPIWIYLKYIITTIIIIITTIITIITITLRIIPNKILGTGDLFCGPSLPLPSSWSAMSRGAGLRGPNLGTWRGRCPKFPKFRAWDMAGLVQNDSNTVSSNVFAKWDGPKQ